MLVVAELALAVVLLIGAGLLIRTFAALRSVAPGFDTHNVLTVETALTGARYQKTAGISRMADQVLERVHAIPGVEAAAASSYLPLDSGLGLGFIIEGRPLTEGPSHGGAAWNYVTSRFFDCFQVPRKRGRVFSDRDDAASTPVVVINEAFARRFFKDQDPLGHRLIIGSGMGPNFAQPPVKSSEWWPTRATAGSITIPSRPRSCRCPRWATLTWRSTIPSCRCVG
ncbi:MAG: ABC transporter permease [Ignavibacteriota bacterium]